MPVDELGADTSRRTNATPYSAHHPVPTIERYQQHRQAEDAQTLPPERAKPVEDEDAEVEDGHEPGALHRAAGKLKDHVLPKKLRGEGTTHGEPKKPYASDNHNLASVNESNQNESSEKSVDGATSGPDPQSTNDSDAQENQKHGNDGADTQDVLNGVLDPKEKRKKLQHAKQGRREREVTDPVTHLPVVIHDASARELESLPESLSEMNLSGQHADDHPQRKTRDDGDDNTQESMKAHRGMEKLFPPPDLEATRRQLVDTFQLTLTIGLCTCLLLGVLALLILDLAFSIGPASNGGQGSWHSRLWSTQLATAITLSVLALLGGASVWGLRGWMGRRIEAIWSDEIWSAERKQGTDNVPSEVPESVQWLNSLLSSVWPLVNPDLFTSVADTLEDVMQASLPKMVRMISVEDLGQGSESLRILGVRWLPSGAAKSSVSVDGETRSSKGSTSQGKGEESDRTVQSEGQVPENTKGDDKGQEGKDSQGAKDNTSEDASVAEGMEGEEGEFVNVELAFAYRAKSKEKNVKTRTKNAHLYLAFYLVAGVRFPVWVELRGLVGTLRARLQLTPDPPFFELCTITFLGQPKVDLSCVPLTKKGLNIMELPLISGFVQSSVDAAMAEYVAPKSLTINLKDMIVGDDFKRDTITRGVLAVNIKSARGFKAADVHLGGLMKGSSDAYVAVGWFKFGKPVWTSRVISSDLNPEWDETAYIPVGPDELNAEEQLLVQIWDSDHATADDDLGRVVVSLKELMQSSDTKGKMAKRTDGLLEANSNKELPGSLEWSVGYFAKTGILPDQLQKQTHDPSIRDISQLKSKVAENVGKRLREATNKDESDEFSQQQSQDQYQMQARMISSAPASDEYPSGILSIQIHQIVGLELERKNKGGDPDDDSNGEEDEQDSGLPDSYCEIIINHAKLFKTRTKPKNSTPFFNAGTEKFIRDWRTTEVVVAVRDSRVHENSPLMGAVSLPLGKLFKDKVQINDYFPLVGGIGYGRVRISVIFRSVQLQAPRELLGWDYGTLELAGPAAIKAHPGLPAEYTKLRIRVRTSLSSGKLSPSDGEWHPRKPPLRLAVRKRYAAPLVIEFRKTSALGTTSTPAFAILWLKDIPDSDTDEPITATLSVYRNDPTHHHVPHHHDGQRLQQAESSCAPLSDSERLGALEVKVCFRRGLGPAHGKLAKRSKNVQDVREALGCLEDGRGRGAGVGGGSESESGSDSDSGAEDNTSAPARASSPPPSSTSPAHSRPSSPSLTTTTTSTTDTAPSTSTSPLAQLSDYRANKTAVHAHHRGPMQWKGPRTLAWARDKARRAGGRLSGQFGGKAEGGEEGGVETEV